MLIRNRRLRAMARSWLNAVVNVVEIRGGVMLSMSVSGDQADDGQHGICSIEDPAQIKENWELPHDAAAARLKRGHVLYFLEENGELCSYCWISRTGTSNDVFFGSLFRIPESAIYIWDCATFPRYRNRGYYRSILKRIQAAEPAVNAAYVAVDQLNHVSRRALEWAGFRVCFRYWGVRILRRHAICIALRGRRLLPLNRALATLTHDQVATAA